MRIYSVVSNNIGRLAVLKQARIFFSKPGRIRQKIKSILKKTNVLVYARKIYHKFTQLKKTNVSAYPRKIYHKFTQLMRRMMFLAKRVLKLTIKIILYPIKLPVKAYQKTKIVINNQIHS